MSQPGPGGGHLYACPRGLKGIIEACQGGGGGGSRCNISLSRGAFIYCPGWGWGGELRVCPGGGRDVI